MQHRKCSLILIFTASETANRLPEWWELPHVHFVPYHPLRTQAHQSPKVIVRR